MVCGQDDHNALMTRCLILVDDVSRKDGNTQQLKYIPTMSNVPVKPPPQTQRTGGSCQWATLGQQYTKIF